MPSCQRPDSPTPEEIAAYFYDSRASLHNGALPPLRGLHSDPPAPIDNSLENIARNASVLAGFMQQLDGLTQANKGMRFPEIYKDEMANKPRAAIIGDDNGPQAPFPLRMRGSVVSGFGRGSKELGIPTANIPVDSALWMADVDSGVYFGYAGIQFPSGHSSHPLSIPADVAEQSVVPESKRREGWAVFPMVMSIGYNPFYKNKVRSAEVHVLHPFKEDFYGSQMALDIFGFIRPEYDYVSKESLIKDIQEDCRVAERSLAREKWSERRKDGWLWGEEEKVAASTV